ncbi:MAG: HTTM domain-containing protein [Bacteroidia bacterium]|nr:HTTM domain-containing protein [Bacteroidia bacterium]
MKALLAHLNAPKDAAALAVVRIFIGFLVAFELVHYYFFKPFLKELYLNPEFHFKYHFFGWVPDLEPSLFKLFLVLMGLSFILFGLGWQFRITRWTSFLSISYLFLMERASYLNHWYFLILICFLFLFIPANCLWSLDVRRNPALRRDFLPAWCHYSLLALLSIVYFYSGLVKINPDWMTGVPMDLYLSDALGGSVPSGLGFVMAWTAMVMELVLVPLLLWRRSRPLVFPVVLLFHCANGFLFTIGLFHVMMMALTTLYLPADWPRRVLQRLKMGDRAKIVVPADKKPFTPPRLALLLLAVFFFFQLVIPLRSFLYEGSGLWEEAGFLFSWKMMLEAKTSGQGEAVWYWVRNGEDGELTGLDPEKYGLTWAQKNKLVRNPDLVLQYAHYLGKRLKNPGQKPPLVFADIFLGLNGRPVQRFIHPNVNLMAEERRPFEMYPWVMPLRELTMSKEQ